MILGLNLFKKSNNCESYSTENCFCKRNNFFIYTLFQSYNYFTMATIISNLTDSDKIIQMSNITTSAFLENICISGCEIAHQNYKKDLMIWFAQRDWNLIGIGMEGF